ncbi:MAG: aminotransferase, partial [Pseudomonadota bacterium]
MIDLNDEFPQDDALIFLNHAGVAPWPRRTAQAVEMFAQENITRGPQYYARWEEKEAFLRGQLCRLINASSTRDIALLKNT